MLDSLVCGRQEWSSCCLWGYSVAFEKKCRVTCCLFCCQSGQSHSTFFSLAFSIIFEGRQLYCCCWKIFSPLQRGETAIEYLITLDFVARELSILIHWMPLSLDPLCSADCHNPVFLMSMIPAYHRTHFAPFSNSNQKTQSWSRYWPLASSAMVSPLQPFPFCDTSSTALALVLGPYSWLLDHHLSIKWTSFLCYYSHYYSCSVVSWVSLGVSWGSAAAQSNCSFCGCTSWGPNSECLVCC